jgi:Uma2 family endonuclease
MTEAQAKRWTLAEIEALPDDEWTRYEIVDGELFVSRAAGNPHQLTVNECAVELTLWNRRVGQGFVLPGPGLVFSESDAVIPDIVWVSRERLAAIERDDRLHAAPELVVEVLSPGAANERRDRETKLGLYSRRGVDEYWILDWQAQTVEVYRRQEGQLQLVATLGAQDTLSSPLLLGFSVAVARLFAWP